MAKALRQRKSRIAGVLSAAIIGIIFPGQALSAWQVGTPIVTYFSAPSVLTDAVAQQAVNGGFNVVQTTSLATLDLAQHYGLRAQWSGAIDQATILSIRSHPALYSYYITDEPSASQFGSLASTVSYLRTLDPAHMAYINLFPTYASNAQLGTSGDTITAYNTYLSQYINTVHPSLMSYDHYQLMNGTDTSQYFLNLKLVRDASRQAGLPFMGIVQGCAWASNWRVPNANELRFLNYTNLAYGAQGISYFNYWTPTPYTGGIQPNPDGTQTSVYIALQSINPQFTAIAKQVQSLQSIGAYHSGDQPPGTVMLPGNSPFSFVPSVGNTTYVDGTPVKGMLMGLFGPDAQLANAQYALAVNLNYSSSRTITVSGPGNLSVFDPTTGIWSPTGSNQATLSLLPGGGKLVALTGSGTEWSFEGSGDWNAPSHWAGVGGVPNAVGALGNFLGRITAPHTVYTDTPVTVGTLKFDNANTYLITGLGSLTVQTASGAGSVSVVQGSHKINLPLFFASDTNLSVAGGATLTIADPITIRTGKTVTKNGNLLVQAPLTIEAGGTLVLASGPTTLFGAPILGAGAKINVKNTTMTVDYRGQASPAATINAQLTSGYASGAWNGSGINTSSAVANQTALGWKDDAASQSILVKYTYYGDANLDGQVDISDLGALATAWQTSAVWSQGDFDYSGFVDISDLGKLATNWQRGVGSPLGPSFDDAMASLGLAGVSVPEPTGLALVILGTLLAGRKGHAPGRLIARSRVVLA